MKLVIDIPEKRFTDIQRIASVQLNGRTPTVEQIIANGTPLPKGHGRLIDADELIQDIKDDSQLCYFNSEYEHIIHDKKIDYAIDCITDAPTIIEAEMAEPRKENE